MQLFHILQLHAYHTRSNAGQNMFLIKPVVIRLPVRVQEIRKLVVHAGVAWLVWTDVIDGVAQLKGARVTR